MQQINVAKSSHALRLRWTYLLRGQQCRADCCLDSGAAQRRKALAAAAVSITSAHHSRPSHRPPDAALSYAPTVPQRKPATLDNDIRSSKRGSFCMTQDCMALLQHCVELNVSWGSDRCGRSKLLRSRLLLLLMNFRCRMS